MGRLEAFALGNKPWPAFLDGLGNGLGYALILLIVAVLRELLGSGTLLGYNLLGWAEQYGYMNCGFFVMPAAALIIIGCIIWYQRAKNPELQEQA